MRDGGRQAVTEAQTELGTCIRNIDLALRFYCNFNIWVRVRSMGKVPFGLYNGSLNGSLIEGLILSSLLESVGGTCKK